MADRRCFATWTRGLFAAAGLVPFGCAGKTQVVEEGAVGGAPTNASPAGEVGGGEGGVPTNRFPCVYPFETTGEPSGYFRCNNGMIHRAEIRACPSLNDHPDPGPSGSFESDECTRDADCTASVRGFCGKRLGLHPRNFCFYGCIIDSDCGAGQVCVCGVDPVPSLSNPAPFGTCVRADCTSDSDCLPGFHCAAYDTTPFCHSLAFSCQAPADDCGGNGDCDGQYCTIEAASGGAESAGRRCVEPTCAL